jgi:DNA modification methylase
MNLFNEDCFVILPEIQDKQVDLFLLDLPYNQTACSWDKDIIDLEKMWVEIKRIMKENAIIVFFTTAKFGYKLIHSNPKWFRYDLIWKKSRKVGFLSANKMPLRQHENIYVFKDKAGTYNPQKIEGEPYNKNTKGTTTDFNEAYYNTTTKYKSAVNDGFRHPTSVIEHENIYVFKDKAGTYNPQKTEGKPYVCEQGQQKKLYGKQVDTTITENTGDRHPTSVIEHENIYVFKDKAGTYNPQKTKADKTRDWSKTKQTNNGSYYRKEGETYKSNFSKDSDDGFRHPTSIIENSVLEFKNPKKSLHRTQKPVELCEWLIKTYTNEGDVVCDFCMGSGTTGVACVNTKRQFIGVEKDEEIFKIAYDRIMSL